MAAIWLAKQVGKLLKQFNQVNPPEINFSWLDLNIAIPKEEEDIKPKILASSAAL